MRSHVLFLVTLCPYLEVTKQVELDRMVLFEELRYAAERSLPLTLNLKVTLNLTLTLTQNLNLTLTLSILPSLFP